MGCDMSPVGGTSETRCLDAKSVSRYRVTVMSRYTTTNLRFPTERYQELRYQAERRGTSVASIVRDAVAQYLGHTDSAAAMAFGDDPVDALAGTVAGGPADDSVNHDYYLYGWRKERAHEAAGGHGSAARARTEQRPASS